MSFRLQRRRHGVAAAAAACLCLPAFAQPQASTIVITGNPLGSAGHAQPAAVLSGEGLLLRRAATLGDTLDGLPGVAGSGFGPNSSRPVIRGLDGDRIRVLDNGSTATDASNLSYDHAVALDPLVAERIEVLRGPAALLYGGNATGGVVNVIDHRMPRTRLDGVLGRAEWRVGGAARERAGAAVIEGGQGPWAWHADAFGRRAGDLQVPQGRVPNSAAEAQGGGVGASYVGAHGHSGVKVDSYRNDYGVTVEPDVTIRMRRERVELATEQQGWTGFITGLSARWQHTRYAHDEVEGGGEVGTRFASIGRQLRVEARHAAVGPLTGVVGVQSERLHFAAAGEEAFVPGTRTRSDALFILEEATTAGLQWQGGWRWERVRVSSAGDDAAAIDAPRFGAPDLRRFAPTSGALSVRAPLPAGWAVSASVGRTERAPTYAELYANGFHVATGAYERGDATLRPERSRHAELGLAYDAGALRVKASLFHTRFSNYIALDATGEEALNDEGEALPVHAFRGVRARYRGAEIEGRTLWRTHAWRWALTAAVDVVRGDDLDHGESLARLPPRRLRLGLDAEQGPWAWGATVRHAAAQHRVPAHDSATPAHWLADMWVRWRTRIGATDALWHARLDNLTNRLAYNATSVATIRGLSPAGGRAVRLGLRLDF